MGQTVNVNFKLDLDIKKKMESACESMGLSLSTAFALFARKVGNGNCEIFLPFFNLLKKYNILESVNTGECLWHQQTMLFTLSRS